MSVVRVMDELRPSNHVHISPTVVGYSRITFVYHQIDEFMLYSDEDEEEEDNDAEEEENSRDGGGYIALGGVPHHPSHHHHTVRRKQSFMQVN